MARFLQTLLSASEPMFSVGMAKLEQTTGHSGVDTRLIADITSKAHDVMRRLGLDPRDSTGHEVFLALIAAVRRDAAESLLVDCDFVMLPIDGQIVSFNLIDVIENSHFGLSFENQSLSHGQRSLRGEIVKRYNEHLRTDETVTREIASSIGLLPESDLWYNETNARQIQTRNKETKMVPHVLSVGDIITNAFIKVPDDQAQVSTDDEGYKRLSIELGAKLSYDYVDIVEAAECAPNAAVSLSRLGLSSSLMTWMGDDAPGKAMLEYLKGENVGIEEATVENGVKSNYHYVLRYGADRTKLQRFEDYSYDWREPSKKPDWLYLGVLGEKTWPLHEAIMKYLEENQEIKLIFQPGMYHLRWGTEKLKAFYDRAYIVILNREEAAQVTGRNRDDMTSLVQGMHELGVNVVVITDGPEGAYASEGDKILFMPIYPDIKEPYDRTGAGDAFASTLTAALALGETLETALMWAPINSMNVSQYIGAQKGLLSKDEILKYLENAPEDYKPKVYEG